MDIFDGKTPNHVLVNEYLPGQGILVCNKRRLLLYEPNVDTLYSHMRMDHFSIQPSLQLA